MGTERKDWTANEIEQPPAEPFTFGARTEMHVSKNLPFTFGGVSLAPDNDTKKPSPFGSNKENLTQRLQFEKECLAKAKEQLRRAQQHVDQVSKMVEQTQWELDRSEEDVNKSCVLFECRGVCDNILGFLNVSDLGNVAGVCQKWRFLAGEDRLWKEIVLRKWPTFPPVVTSYRKYCKSLLLRSTPEQKLVFPHWENNQDEEEYYLIVEFPGLRESTPDSPKPIIRSIKLDESLMTDEEQDLYEYPICSCGEWRCSNPSHENAWVRLPINVETTSFDLEQLHHRIQFKVSILRSSDCKVALLFDPSSSGFSTLIDEDEHPEDILHFYGDQTLREIPNFVGTDAGGESQLSFQVWGGVECYENYEQISFPEKSYGSTTCFRRFEDGTYGVHINRVLFGFVTYEEGNDKHHMAPPYRSKCVTEFLAMAGVEWH